MPLLQLSPQWIQDKPIDAKIHHLYNNTEEQMSAASRSEPTPQVNVQVFVIYPSLIDQPYLDNVSSIKLKLNFTQHDLGHAYARHKSSKNATIKASQNFKFN